MPSRVLNEGGQVGEHPDREDGTESGFPAEDEVDGAQSTEQTMHRDPASTTTDWRRTRPR